MKYALNLFVFVLVCMIPMSATASIAIAPDAKHAETWKKFNDAVDNKTSEIKSLVFGPITRIIGMLALAYAIISAWMTTSTRQLMLFGGMGIVMTIAPSFIDTLFSALLPRM